MRKIDLLFSEYAQSHRNSTNKIIHYFCVPIIFWTILGFISLIPAPHIFLKYIGYLSVVSVVAIALVMVYYFVLSWKIALSALFFLLLMEHLVYANNVYFQDKAWWVYLTLFVITWILQFVGHKIEGKKPSFLKDLQFLLIGPIWILKKILPYKV